MYSISGLEVKRGHILKVAEIREAYTRYKHENKS